VDNENHGILLFGNDTYPLFGNILANFTFNYMIINLLSIEKTRSGGIDDIGRFVIHLWS